MGVFFRQLLGQRWSSIGKKLDPDNEVLKEEPA